MDGSQWLAVGTVVAAILALAGVVYSTRQRPEQSVTALGVVLKNLGEENTRLNNRITELEMEIENLRKEIKAYRNLVQR